MQLNRVDIREGVADMQMLHRVDVDARLTTQNAGVARSKLIGWRVVDEDRLIVLICQLLAIDVMVDAIGKQRELCRNDRRRIIQTKVELPAVFRLQTGISQFVSLGSPCTPFDDNSLMFGARNPLARFSFRLKSGRIS